MLKHALLDYLSCGAGTAGCLLANRLSADLDGRRQRYPRGKLLGSSGSINGMGYMRGQAGGYDAWATGEGVGANTGWGWDECPRYCLNHEDFYKGAGAFHAAPGFDPTGAHAGGEWCGEKQRLR